MRPTALVLTEESIEMFQASSYGEEQLSQELPKPINLLPGSGCKTQNPM